MFDSNLSSYLGVLNFSAVVNNLLVANASDRIVIVMLFLSATFSFFSAVLSFSTKLLTAASSASKTSSSCLVVALVKIVTFAQVWKLIYYF